jgi:hypothetical protein
VTSRGTRSSQPPEPRSSEARLGSGLESASWRASASRRSSRWQFRPKKSPVCGDGVGRRVEASTRPSGPSVRARAVHPAAAPSCSTSSCCPTSSGRTGSASSGSPPQTRTFGEILIDLEEDRAARAVVFGLLREMERNSGLVVLRSSSGHVGAPTVRPEPRRSRLLAGVLCS